MPLGARDILLIVRAQDEASHVVRNIGNSLGGIGTQAGLTGQKMMSIGSGMTSMGVGLTAVGAAGLALMDNAVNAAVEYEKQAALTLTQTRNLGIGLDEIKDIGKRVAAEIPAPFEEMQEALFDIFSSMDVNGPQAEEILKGISRAAVAGATDIQTAGRATIAILNGFKIPVEELNRVLDIQFELVRSGVGTYEEFASSIGRAIPSANRAGQSVEMLSGMMAFLTRNGLSADMSATSAARAFDLLSNPKFGNALKSIGLNAYTATGQVRPMTEVVADLRKKFEGWSPEAVTKELAELTRGSGGTIQAMRFLNLAINDTNNMFPELVGRMSEAEGAMDGAFNVMAETSAMKIQLMKNQMAILRTEIGDKLLPVKLKLMEVVMKLLNKWNELSPATQELIIKIAAIAAVVATVGGVLLMFAGTLATIVGGVMVAFSVSLGGAIALLAALAVAVVGVIAGIAAYATNFMGAKDAMDEMGVSVEGFKKLLDNLKQGWDAFMGAFSGDGITTEAGTFIGTMERLGVVALATKDALVAGFQELWSGLQEIWGNINNSVGNAIRAFAELFNTVLADVRDWWKNNGAEMLASAMEVVATLQENVMPLWIALKEAISHVLNVIMGIVKVVLEAITFLWQAGGDDIMKVAKAAWNMIMGVIKGAINIIAGIIGAVLHLINGDWGKAWDSIVQALKGAWQIIVSVIEGAIKVVWNVVKGLVNAIWQFFQWLWDALVGNSIVPDMVNAIIDWFKSLKDKAVQWVKDLVTGAINWFIDLNLKAAAKVRELVDNVVNFFGELPGKIRNKITELKDNVVLGFTVLKDAAVGKVTEVKDNVIRGFHVLKDEVVGKVTEIKNNVVAGFHVLKDAVIGKVQEVITWFKGLAGMVIGAIGDLSGHMRNIGINMIQGLINGISSMAGAAANAAKSAVSGAIEGAKSLLKIGSPSKVFEEIGINTGLGMVVGLNKMIKPIENAMTNMTLPGSDGPTLGTSFRGMGANTGGTNITVSEGAVQLIVEGNITEDAVPAVQEAIDEALATLISELQAR